MKNYKQDGKSVELTAPAGGVSSGVGYVIGSLFCVAEHDAAAGEKFTAVIEGVVELPLDAAHAPSEGDVVEYDNTAKDVVAQTLGDLDCGIALETKGAAAGQTLLVKIERA